MMQKTDDIHPPKTEHIRSLALHLCSFSHSLNSGSSKVISLPSTSMRSFFCRAFFTDWTLAEDSRRYFLITSLRLKPEVMPLARARRKLSCISVSCSTSLWKNTLFCSSRSSIDEVMFSSVTTSPDLYHTTHERCCT